MTISRMLLFGLGCAGLGLSQTVPSSNQLIYAYPQAILRVLQQLVHVIPHAFGVGLFGQPDQQAIARRARLFLCVPTHYMAGTVNMKDRKMAQTKPSSATPAQAWEKRGWRAYPRVQMPDYPDQAALQTVERQLAKFPPLVFAGEARRLRKDCKA